jgi:cobyrinic acid a,c-diamide synthase
MVFLPGGYPELHAGRLVSAEKFRAGLKAAARNSIIYGECGGYMVMGDGLVDADGKRHQMLGLLALETSFEQRKLHLGYRRLVPLSGPFDGPLMAHEFHYATILKADGKPLFEARDAEGNALAPMGLVDGRICGSFAHVIDRGI